MKTNKPNTTRLSPQTPNNPPFRGQRGPAEFERQLAKCIARSQTDDDIDGCIAITKRYRAKGPAYDAALDRLYRGVLLQRLRINQYMPVPLTP